MVLTDSPSSNDTIDGVLIFEDTPPPPEQFVVKGIATVEDQSKEKRYKKAAKEAIQSGGNAIIPQKERTDRISTYRQIISPNTPGGFKMKQSNEKNVIQDFLVIRLKDSYSEPTQVPEPVYYPPPQPYSQPAPRASQPELTSETFPEQKPPEQAQSTPKESESNFIDNKDGTVTDIESGKTWELCNSGKQYSYGSCAGNSKTGGMEEAKQYCQNLKYAGLKWRLPSKSELMTLLDINSKGTNIQEPFHGKTASDLYWTETYFDAQNESAWVVDFSDGSSFPYGIMNRAFSRCISSNN